MVKTYIYIYISNMRDNKFKLIIFLIKKSNDSDIEFLLLSAKDR